MAGKEKLYRDKNWLRARYVEGLGVPTIAKLAGCSHPTVSRWLCKFGIKRRSKVEAGRAKVARYVVEQKKKYLGKRFGRLVVEGYAGYRKKEGDARYHCWGCRCDCGNEKIVLDNNLRSGNTRSCGCLNDEIRGSNRLPPGEAAFNNLFLLYRIGASDRGYKWELSSEQFRELVTQPCYYCGEPPSQVAGASRPTGGFVYNGIDRVDNGQGYVGGNVVPCCWACNSGKGTQSAGEFLALVERIHEYQMRRTAK